MTGFTPNQLQEAFKKGDNEILDKAFDEELNNKKVTYLNKHSKLEI